MDLTNGRKEEKVDLKGFYLSLSEKECQFVIVSCITIEW